ncbi:hypothetical protein E4U41_006577 [Claviceps citrina]|nr:hypothetical protein E4U41_006577 [Claviceps citrina]
MSASSDTEGPRSPSRVVSSPPPATDSAMLRPNTVHRIPSNLMNIMSPSDIVGPSPVTSNGTETTEIEDDASDEIDQGHDGDLSRTSELLMLTTNLPETVRQSSAEEAVSVIHAPESFATWPSTSCVAPQHPPSEPTYPKADEEALADGNEPLQKASVHPPRPPISTDVKPVRYSLDSATPRAQDLQDMMNDGSRLRSSSTSSLEKIDEQTENEGDDDDDEYSGVPVLRPAPDKIQALRTALQNCWTLCKTLAGLSAAHRARIFHSSRTPNSHAKAWKTCWKLCQRLYDNQDNEDPASLSVGTNLELCRDFCQALFDIRPKKDETADSILRVSFELNNHLFSAQDNGSLPGPFSERTLDFYITLCHRLMKQRSELAEETHHLLSTCWGFAEMLFSLRQNKRDGKPLDEDLLDSAGQACWELCKLFKDGCWTQIRPDRNTPRPNQTSFFPQQAGDQSGRESRQSTRSSIHSKREMAKGSSHQEERAREPAAVPETPVTEFEDTPISPESRSPPMPNIMVLGTSSDGGRGGRWSSNASNMSSYSHSSNRTSSTATTATATEDVNVMRCKVLVLRAVMNMGFNRDTMTDPMTESAILEKFVQGLPAGSFGSLPSHATLLQQFKSSILTDSFLPRGHPLPGRSKRVMAQDMAKSVMAMSSSSPRYAFLRDLFKFVFQFTVDEAETRRNVSIVV